MKTPPLTDRDGAALAVVAHTTHPARRRLLLGAAGAVVATLTGCPDSAIDGAAPASLPPAATPAPPLNHAPVANAGAAQNVLLGATVTLDGRASTDPEGSALTMRWVLDQLPPGSQAVLT